MIRPHRSHPLWYAFILHRISGLLLAFFLPAHFWLLALALNEAARLDGLLSWAELTSVKVAEFGLVFLLSVHFLGGLRLLALELLPWTVKQKNLAAGAFGLAILISGTFFLRAI
jgi:fumarate reductase subunit D